MFQINWPSGFYYVFIFIDILIVSYLAYKAIIYMLNTKTINILKGFLGIGLVFLFAHLFQLKTLLWILEKGIELLPLTLLIVFQPEIRRIFISFGTPKIFLKWKENEEAESLKTLNAILGAMEKLSQKKVGALILIQQEAELFHIKEKAVILNADVSESLLISIFLPHTPLHDGAVIIKDNKIVAARAFLPITEEKINPQFGSRHRAAIGVSEITDALSLVVSEETGYISLAYKGTVYYNIGIEIAREKALDILGIKR